MSDYDDLFEESGAEPPQRSGRRPAPPAPETVAPESHAAVAGATVIRTMEDAVQALAERGKAVASVALPPRTPGVAPPRSAKKKKVVEKGDGRCGAYAPKGTKCKLCGKVHPQ